MGRNEEKNTDLSGLKDPLSFGQQWPAEWSDSSESYQVVIRTAIEVAIRIANRVCIRIAIIHKKSCISRIAVSAKKS